MTKDELWEIITRKNPQFLRPVVKIKAADLKRLFDVAYREGAKGGEHLFNQLFR